RDGAAEADRRPAVREAGDRADRPVRRLPGEALCGRRVRAAGSGAGKAAGAQDFAEGRSACGSRVDPQALRLAKAARQAPGALTAFILIDLSRNWLVYALFTSYGFSMPT